MRTFFSVSLIMFLLLNCHSLRKARQEKIWGVLVERNVPQLDFDTSKNQIIIRGYVTHYTKLYYYNDQVLLQSTYQSRDIDLGQLTEDDTTEIFHTDSYELRYFTFIYSNNLDQGWRCDSNDVRSGRIVSKDSMFSKEWIVLLQNYKLLESNYCTLVSSTKSKDGTITEEYKAKNKADTSMTAKIILTFSEDRFNGFKYSLAKDIEEQKKKKVIKMVTINNARHIPPTNTYIGRVEVYSELKKITITNESELLKLFEAARAALK